MKRAVFDFVTTAAVVTVATTTLLVAGLAGSTSTSAAHVVPAHLCPPAC
jgi:hypothetical protein